MKWPTMTMQNYNKAVMEDKFGINDLEADVNFSTDKKLKKYVRIKIGDKVAVIAIKDLHAFVFAVGDVDQKADLLETKRTYNKRLIRSHIVRMKEAVPKDGQVTIRCETDVPLAVYEELQATWLENQNLKTNKQVDVVKN